MRSGRCRVEAADRAGPGRAALCATFCCVVGGWPGPGCDSGGGVAATSRAEVAERDHGGWGSPCGCGHRLVATALVRHRDRDVGTHTHRGIGWPSPRSIASVADAGRGAARPTSSPTNGSAGHTLPDLSSGSAGPASRGPGRVGGCRVWVGGGGCWRAADRRCRRRSPRSARTTASGRVNVTCWWCGLNSSRNESSTIRSPSASRSGMPWPLRKIATVVRVPARPVRVGHRLRRRGAARRCR